MAEMLLKVNGGANYEDGDVICAFRDHDIQCIHAQLHCHYKKSGLSSDGLRNGQLALDYLDTVYQYRFERVSKTEVKRTETDHLGNVIGTPEVFGPESMNVEVYVRRRLSHQHNGTLKHRIFGVAGAEVWHGGRSDLSEAAIARAWDRIEHHTSNLRTEVNHLYYPLGRQDIRSHLPLAIDDFTAIEKEALISPEYESDDNGEFVWRDQAEGSSETAKGNEPPDDGKQWDRTIVSKRNVNADWVTDGLPLLGVSEAMVRDKRTPIDKRRTMMVIPESHREKLYDRRKKRKIEAK